MVADQLIALVAMMLVSASQARSIDNDASVSAVIPSPEQDFGDGQMDIQRMGVAASGATSRPSEASNAIEAQEVAESSNEASVPVYVSPFQRAQRGATIATPVMPASYEQRQESSHAPPNYAPNPAASATGADLKTSASYGRCSLVMLFGWSSNKTPIRATCH